MLRFICATARARARTSQVGAYLVVYGGRDARKSYNSIWKLDTRSHEWFKPLPMGVQPPPSSRHTMVAKEGRLFLALGEIARDRVFIYDTSTDAWLQVPFRARSNFGSAGAPTSCDEPRRTPSNFYADGIAMSPDEPR